MKLKSKFFSTIALTIMALTTGEAIAAPIPVPFQAVCHQHGEDYQYLYSVEVENSTIAICQKGKQHYYLRLPKNAPDATQKTTPSLNPTPTKPSRIYQASAIVVSPA
jgi:hypothetical protein